MSDCAVKLHCVKILISLYISQLFALFFKKLEVQLHPLGLGALYHLHHNITLVKRLPCKCILYYKNDVRWSLKIIVANIGAYTIVCRFLYFR
jgi:hypothetical protein